MGKPFMGWQRYVADVALEVDAAGRFAYQLVVVTVPRQSGKSLLFGVVLDHRALVVPRARAWFTQQSGKHAVDWLLNEHWPLLAPFVPHVHLRRAAGSEHVKWVRSGGLIRPFPPTPDGLHSKVSDLVVVDEPWAFDLVHGRALDAAVVPTTATRPNAQVWKVSTAGDAASTWWLGTVEAGRAAAAADRREGVAFFEWACPDHLDPTEPASWPLYHPAYGQTIGAEAMAGALEMLGPDEFARAYGNRWVSTTSRVIPLGAWRAAAEDGVELPGPGEVALAFDVAIDRSDGVIVAGWRDGAAQGHVEIVDYRDGAGWIPERLAELVAKWRPSVVAYGEGGPAIDVADVARRAGVDVVPLSAKDYVAACLGFLEALTTEPPTVGVRRHEALDAAAAGAARRAYGDTWVWSRRQSGTSIAPLTAATVALWAFDHAPAPGEFHIY
jgi:hypothetical protein